MAEAVTEVPEKVVARIGKQLAAYKTCPNKSIIVKLLKQAASAFGKLQQSKSLEVSVKPLSDSLVMHGLFDHKDKDVRHLVGRCLCEVLRVLAPNPDFSDAVSRDIFRFLLSMFGELVDTEHTYFSERAKMLETVAKLRFYFVMLDTGCEDLIFKMFKVFFSVVRENHPQSLISSMSSIIVNILEEKVEADSDPREKNTCQSLLDVIFQNIIKEKKDAAPDSFRLAESVIKHFGEKMEHSISQFLISCILNRDAVDSVIKESYHEIVVEIYRIAPQLLLSVIPCLTHELLTDQVDVRIKALNLIRKLIASGPHVVLEYPNLFIELLNRFSDKSAEVRLAALSCAKALYMTNPSGKESVKTLSAIQDRLLDNDDKVRIGAINVVCELSKTNLNLTSSDLITQAAKRLRDKKVLVRRKALEKLIELYQEYCTRRAERNTLRRTEGNTLLNEHIEEIPCEVLMLCYEKDCQEFRPQSLDLVLADLFPFSLSIEEKISRWIFMFSLFKPPHLKALRTILSIKRRLRDGLNDYLDLWSISEVMAPDGNFGGILYSYSAYSLNRQENSTSWFILVHADSCCVEAERKMEALVAKMASCFPDPAKAKDCFQKLKELKDNGVLSVLQQMLIKGTILDSEATKGVYFRELGDRKALSEFLLLLSKKCSLSIFGSEPVHYILNCLSGDKAEKKHLKNYQVQLLLTIISAFPSLLRGSEKQFQLLLLEREILFNDQLVEMLAREGYHLSIKLSDIYSSLEEICLEGTRRQAKLAVSAIATLAGSSEQLIFSELCKTLVDSLCNGENVPTVLQSLGCMSQHSVSTFEAQEKVIAHYIFEEIFRQNDVPASKDLDIFVEASNCCSSCKLKIFGLKALVRSFLPHKHTSLNRPISSLLGVILQMLQQCALSAGSIACENDDSFIRLAAARSVLRLSRKWDLHISPEIFRLTILVAKENSPEIRRSFARKINKLLKNHAVPGRYACAFSFVAIDPLEDLRSDALKYLEEFVREYSKGVQIHEITTMQGAANHPVYLVVCLIHVLAHDPNFPAPDCRDEKTYAQFLSPLFVTVQALVNEHLVQSDVTLNSNASLYLRSIFCAIKKAEDAIDDQMTPKLHLLAEVGICILNSLNTNSTGSPHAPGLILLPSSLYKIGPSKMREANAYPLIGSRADVKFTKKMISWLKTEVSVNGSTRTNIQPSGSRNNSSSSKSSNPDDFLMNKNKDQVVEASNCDFETRGRHNTFAAENKHERDPCRNLRSKPTFPCNSATTKPSLSQKNDSVSCSREEDTVNESGTNCTEPSKSSRAGDQVTHETEEVDILSLDSEMCETDLDDLQAQRCGDSVGSSANDEDKILDAEGFDSIQENLPRKRNKSVRKASSQAVKRSKRCEDAIGSLTSEVIDTYPTDSKEEEFDVYNKGYFRVPIGPGEHRQRPSMANLKTDSPLSRRIARSFLQFLNSVEPSAGVDTEALDVARDCLVEVFKIDQSSLDSQSNCDSLVDIFSASAEARASPVVDNGGVSDAPTSSSGKNAEVLKDQDRKREPHSHGKDELFGYFFGALEKIHYFRRMPDGNDDQIQLDRATRLFNDAVKEMQVAGCQTFDQKSLAEVFKSQGNKAMQSKLYKEAVELYNFAIALCEDNAVYYCNRAAAYTQMHRYAEAVQDCLKSIEINPNYSKAYSRLGFAYYAQGKYRNAIDKGFTKALQLDPNNDSVKENIRVAEQKLKEEQQRAESGQSSTSTSRGGEPRSNSAAAPPPPFASMPFNISGITNMVINMTGGQNGTHEESENNEPGIRFGGNMPGNIPEELSGAFRSMMGMFSGAASQPDDRNGRSSPS